MVCNQCTHSVRCISAADYCKYYIGVSVFKAVVPFSSPSCRTFVTGCINPVHKAREDVVAVTLDGSVVLELSIV